jgi:hypothetical protein
VRDGLAGEVHDRVAAGERPLPRARRRGAAADELHAVGAAAHGARQDDHLVAALDERVAEGRPDETRAAGDEDAHA